MSSNFRIFETQEFKKQLNKLDAGKRHIINTKLRDYAYPQLESEPFYGQNIKKLKRYEPDTWRYRIGDFRIFYVVDTEKDIVYILTIIARKYAYKN